MIENLPTPRDLEKLTLRSIVAYAARTVHRLNAEIESDIPRQVLDDLVARIESVYTSVFMGEVDGAALLFAASRVPGIMRSIRDTSKKRFALSFTRVAMAAHVALRANEDPTQLDRCTKYAAREANRAVRSIEALHSKSAREAVQAARRDYNSLIAEYGEHDAAVIGDPVTCFAEES
jgi:hypothetical protein